MRRANNRKLLSEEDLCLQKFVLVLLQFLYLPLIGIQDLRPMHFMNPTAHPGRIENGVINAVSKGLCAFGYN